MAKIKIATLNFDIKANTSGFNRAMAHTIKTLGNVEKQVNKLGGYMMRNFTAPIVAAGALATKAFADFESGISNVQTLLSKSEIGKYGDDLERLTKNALKNGFAMADANKALFDSVSALGAGRVAFETFETAQRLAIGGAADMSVALDGLTSVVNAYGRDTTSASDVANALFTAQKRGKTTVAELSSNIGKIAPVAKMAGVGFKELSALMAQLTLGGLSTDEATTALRGTMQALIKPGEEAQKTFTRLGIPFGATALQANGFVNVLKKLSLATGENKDIIAEAVPEIRGMLAASTLTTEALASVDAIVREINTDIANGTGLNEAYALKTQDITFKLKQLWGALNVVAIQIGEVLAPVVSYMTERLQALTDWLEQVDKDTLKWIVGVAAITAAIAPMLLGLGMIIGALKTTLGVVALLNVALSPLIIAFSVLGVGLAAVALTFAAFSDGVADFARRTGFEAQLLKLQISILKVFDGIGYYANQAWAYIKYGFVTAAGAIIAAVEYLGNMIKTTFIKAINFVIDKINSLVEQINDVRAKLEDAFGFGGGKFDIIAKVAVDEKSFGDLNKRFADYANLTFDKTVGADAADQAKSASAIAALETRLKEVEGAEGVAAKVAEITEPVNNLASKFEPLTKSVVDLKSAMELKEVKYSDEAIKKAKDVVDGKGSYSKTTRAEAEAILRGERIAGDSKRFEKYANTPQASEERDRALKSRQDYSKATGGINEGTGNADVQGYLDGAQSPQVTPPTAPQMPAPSVASFGGLGTTVAPFGGMASSIASGGSKSPRAPKPPTPPRAPRDAAKDTPAPNASAQQGGDNGRLVKTLEDLIKRIERIFAPQEA